MSPRVHIAHRANILINIDDKDFEREDEQSKEARVWEAWVDPLS